MYVKSQKDFEEFLKYANTCDAVAIDTEFIREKTYWPKLCLLQLACKDRFILVDPFSVDIKPISELLDNPNIVKVFHAPKQDIEILRHKTGSFPIPIFDTQTAASFLGHRAQVGYGRLVHVELGIKLSKSDSFTDWSLRPLSSSQVKYAQEDVTHLLNLYYKMSKKLKSLGRDKWVEEDTKKFISPETYDIDPCDRFRHLRRINCIAKKRLAAAQEVAAWREVTAAERNIPRRWVISDEQIIEICRMPATSVNKLFMIRGMKKHISTSDAREIVGAVNKGLNCKREDMPTLDSSKSDNCSNLPENGIGCELDIMSALVKLRAKENSIAPQMICNNHDLSMLAHGHFNNSPLMNGWRKEIVGDELKALIEGKIQLSLKNGDLIVTKC